MTIKKGLVNKEYVRIRFISSHIIAPLSAYITTFYIYIPDTYFGTFEKFFLLINRYLVGKINRDQNV